MCVCAYVCFVCVHVCVCVCVCRKDLNHRMDSKRQEISTVQSSIRQLENLVHDLKEKKVRTITHAPVLQECGRDSCISTRS